MMGLLKILILNDLYYSQCWEKLFQHNGSPEWWRMPCRMKMTNLKT